MKNIVILIFLMCFCSCRIGKYEKFSYTTSDNTWIAAYKDNVFFACLKESYQNDSIFKLIEKKDALNPYDGLSLNDLNKIKELGQNIIKNIPPPMMCENCKEGVNYYMANCLHYYKSRELDSIAKKAYKDYMKKSN